MASGNTATSDVKDILKNELYFPPFEELTDENGLDERYYKEDHRGVWVRSCTWCFLGEITNDETSQIAFLRNRVVVKDRRDRSVSIFFYPECGSFDYRTLKKGHTICVMVAERHYFLDLTVGLRIEDLDRVKMIPCALDDLFAISTFYSQNYKACWTCKKKTPDDGEAAVAVNLKKCATCHIAQYCGKECQVKDWKERHRRWCKALPEFLKLTKILIDWSKVVR